jgi:hypothetical protein
MYHASSLMPQPVTQITAGYGESVPQITVNLARLLGLPGSNLEPEIG